MENQSQQPLSQPITPTQSSIAQPTISHKPSMLLIGIGAAVLLAVGLAGGYFLQANNQTQSHSVDKQIRIPRKEASPTVIPLSATPTIISNTSDSWKPYTNNTFHYSIQVPSYMHHDTQNDNEFFYQGPMTICCGYQGPNLAIYASLEKENPSWVTTTFSKSPSDSVKKSIIVEGTKLEVLSGLQGIRIGPLKKNGYIYGFLMYGKDTYDSPDLYRMLSSFTLTN